MKLTNKIDGALVRTAAIFADRLRQAMRQTIDPENIAQQLIEAFPEGHTLTPGQARTWALMNVRFDNRAVVLVLQDLWATGWVMGQDAGAAHVADQR